MRILYLPNQYSQQRQHEKKRWIYPVRLAMEATFYKQMGYDVYWWPSAHKKPVKYDIIVKKPDGHFFSQLPAPDRKFTDAMNPKYQNNGNFKYRPATYMQVASGCWWGQCNFCVENQEKWDVRPVESVLEEIWICKKQGYKEIFDDSGSFPKGEWLDEFLNVVIYNNLRDIRFGCNARMCDYPFKDMRKAGFRMLLFGVESANQKTLDRINKGVNIDDHKYIIKASKAGLENHIAVMFGYPWETDKDAQETLKLVWYLLKKGYAKTAQASFYSVQGQESRASHKHYVKKIYGVAKSPEFWFNKIRDIHNVDDLKYLWRQIKEGLNCITNQS